MRHVTWHKRICTFQGRGSAASRRRGLFQRSGCSAARQREAASNNAFGTVPEGRRRWESPAVQDAQQRNAQMRAQTARRPAGSHNVPRIGPACECHGACGTNQSPATLYPQHWQRRLPSVPCHDMPWSSTSLAATRCSRSRMRRSHLGSRASDPRHRCHHVGYNSMPCGRTHLPRRASARPCDQHTRPGPFAPQTLRVTPAERQGTAVPASLATEPPRPPEAL